MHQEGRPVAEIAGGYAVSSVVRESVRLIILALERQDQPQAAEMAQNLLDNLVVLDPMPMRGSHFSEVGDELIDQEALRRALEYFSAGWASQMANDQDISEVANYAKDYLKRYANRAIEQEVTNYIYGGDEEGSDVA